MKIAIAQMNPIVGDVKYNAQKALQTSSKYASLGAQLIIFPELFLSGYPPKDLILRQDFLELVNAWAQKLAQQSPIPLIIGAPYGQGDLGLPYNTALWCYQNQVKILARKILLPNYTVFDEKRYFSTPKKQACEAFEFNNKKFLISICEDSWNIKPGLTPINYPCDPVSLGFLENKSVDYFINISASPYTTNKPALREQIFTYIAQKFNITSLIASQVGANDQLLFDGNSMIISPEGEILARAKACEEDILLYDSTNISPIKSPKLNSLELTYKALIMGIKDYITKCQSQGLVLGLSGGIDSAVCAVLAVEALGPEKVKVFYLPSQFSSNNSLRDAQEIADNLKLKLEIIPIEKAVHEVRQSLNNILNNASESNRDLCDQNIQARMRGLILMGISNAQDYYLLNTSNKSELAVGYGTLYGDMCGAFSPLGDMYKTDVWRLAREINKKQELIPERVIKKAPTAELRPNQQDSDSLPDYLILDKILYNYINLNLNPQKIQAKTKLNISLINNIIKLVNRSEYKRRQAPLTFMISNRVFGDARRLPIAKRLQDC